jgi:hypothetical protein
MTTLVAFNTTLKNIVTEVEKFNQLEQESILAYLRARRLEKRTPKLIGFAQKPLSMATIDAIKHKSRKSA